MSMTIVKDRQCVSSKVLTCCLRLAPAVCAVFLCACRSTPPPPVIPQVAAPAPVAAPAEVRVDDIPADAPAAVRGHLIKLREMRDRGQISEGDYQSRKASLLGL